jgi:hypothetical protein
MVGQQQSTVGVQQQQQQPAPTRGGGMPPTTAFQQQQQRTNTEQCKSICDDCDIGVVYSFGTIANRMADTNSKGGTRRTTQFVSSGTRVYDEVTTAATTTIDIYAPTTAVVCTNAGWCDATSWSLFCQYTLFSAATTTTILNGSTTHADAAAALCTNE